MVHYTFAGCLVCAGFLLLQGASNEREKWAGRLWMTLALDYMHDFG
jgi:hypothetical protein